MFRKLQFLMMVVFIVAMSCVSAFAVDPSAALFAAVDTSAIATNVSTILISLVTIPVIFLGFRYLKKALGRG